MRTHVLHTQVIGECAQPRDGAHAHGQKSDNQNIETDCQSLGFHAHDSISLRKYKFKNL